MESDALARRLGFGQQFSKRPKHDLELAIAFRLQRLESLLQVRVVFDDCRSRTNALMISTLTRTARGL